MSHQATIATKNAVIFQVEAVTATADSMDFVQAASSSRQRDDQLEWFQQMRALLHTYTKTGGSSAPTCTGTHATRYMSGRILPAAPPPRRPPACPRPPADAPAARPISSAKHRANPPRGLARSDPIFGFSSGQF